VHQLTNSNRAIFSRSEERATELTQLVPSPHFPFVSEAHEGSDLERIFQMVGGIYSVGEARSGRGQGLQFKTSP
jgi:hypothetical protein